MGKLSPQKERNLYKAVMEEGWEPERRIREGQGGSRERIKFNFFHLSSRPPPSRPRPPPPPSQLPMLLCYRQGNHVLSPKQTCLFFTPSLNSYPLPSRSRLALSWPPGYRTGQTPPSLSSELAQQSPSAETHLCAASQIGFVFCTFAPSTGPTRSHMTIRLHQIL